MLTKKQGKLITEISKGKSISEAGEKAGYSCVQATSRALKHPVVAKRIDKILKSFENSLIPPKEELLAGLTETMQESPRHSDRIRGYEILLKASGHMNDSNVNVGLVFNELVPDSNAIRQAKQKLANFTANKPTPSSQTIDCSNASILVPPGDPVGSPRATPCDSYNTPQHTHVNFEVSKDYKKLDYAEGANYEADTVYVDDRNLEAKIPEDLTLCKPNISSHEAEGVVPEITQEGDNEVSD